MNGIDITLMHQVMQEAHCPDPRCFGRNRPGGIRQKLRPPILAMLAQEGIALVSVREMLKPARSSGSSAQPCC